MSDNLRPYRAIRTALTQGYPGEPPGQRARHLTTLAALISGLVASQRTPLPAISAKVPAGSVVGRARRSRPRCLRLYTQTVPEKASTITGPHQSKWPRWAQNAQRWSISKSMSAFPILSCVVTPNSLRQRAM